VLDTRGGCATIRLRGSDGQHMHAETATDNWEKRAGPIIAFLCPVIFLLPFIAKPFHIDDTMYLWAAKQIHAHPLDFYGFDVHWDNMTRPMYEANQNPPGVSYYIAFVALLLGWSELAQHAGMLLLTALASLGIYRLAERLCSRPLLAVLLSVLTPAFLVSSSNVMSDTPMLCAYVWAIVLWLRGLDANNHRLLFAASLLMACAALIKYYGITAVPLLLVYTLIKKRRLGPWSLHLLTPLLVFGAYVLLVYKMYGINLASSVSGFATDSHWRSKETSYSKPLTGILFTGGCFITALFYAPFVWSRKYFLAAVGIVLIIMLPGTILRTTLEEFTHVLAPTTTLYYAQLAIMLVVGIHFLAMPLSDLYTRRNADALLVNLLFWGTFVFSVYINYAINVRTLLPVAMVTGIVIVRHIDRHEKPDAPPVRRALYWPLLPGAIMALWVAIGDYQAANTGRDAAKFFAEAKKNYPGPVYYLGHWGFQYYMDLDGTDPLIIQRDANQQISGIKIDLGDTLIIPLTVNPEFTPVPGSGTVVVNRELYPIPSRMATLQGVSGAGFYSHFVGRLPYAIGPVTPEEYIAAEIRASESTQTPQTN